MIYVQSLSSILKEMVFNFLGEVAFARMSMGFPCIFSLITFLLLQKLEQSSLTRHLRLNNLDDGSAQLTTAGCSVWTIGSHISV